MKNQYYSCIRDKRNKATRSQIKKTTLLIAFIFLFIIVQAQDYQIDFTAFGAATTLDSVHVLNLTRQTERMLAGTDTLHLYKNGTGIDEKQTASGDLSFYPNPLKNGEGTLRFYQSMRGETKVEIYDMEGRLLLSKQRNLPDGHNAFMFTGMPTGFFMVHVKSASYSRSMKIISMDGKQGAPDMVFIQNTQADAPQASVESLMAVESIMGMPYTDGEPLKLTGYAGSLTSADTIIPTQSQTMAFYFAPTAAPVADFIVSDTLVQLGDTLYFSDQSANMPISWRWSFGDGDTSDVQNPVHVYDAAGTFTVSLTATNHMGWDTEIRTDYITVTDTLSASYPSGTVHCIPGGAAVVDVTNPVTGDTWMDRNLGAPHQAASSNDSIAYGDLYQWGRFSDGHQCRNSSTTDTNATTATPGAGNYWDGLFIADSSSPYDWLTQQNHSLWQGLNGTNNPCPGGYRLPTEYEWENERQTWSSNNASGAYNSPLKLPVAGYRLSSNGSLVNVHSYGYYWINMVDGSYALYLFFDNTCDAYIYNGHRASGQSVRCIKD